MKVSLNLAQYFANVDLKAIPKDELLKRIGAQLGAIEEVTDWAPKYDGIYVVKVVACEKHPDADKLNVCRIDDGGAVKHAERGEDGLVQVVCGAPNVQAGMYVAWIPPKSTVPSSVGTSDPFVLEARTLRGVVSNGMLASASELGISDDHSGLLEITAEAVGREPQPGDRFVEYFGLDDLVIDCENKMFTHRPDCFGNLGVARELAGISGLAYRSPDWYFKPLVLKTESNLAFISKNEIPKLVSRFSALVLEGVAVRPSLVWMQAALTRVGIRPINNIVDATNYYMHLTAQPTHAFDYDKIKALCDGAPTIFPRMAEEGETLTLLNGKTITLTKDDMVIATDTKAVALAGVMGGAETEVGPDTKNIIIECATFDMYAVRRTSMRHGLFTDAVTRFNKGQSPLQNGVVLAKLGTDLCEQTGAKAGVRFDTGEPKDLPKHRPVSVRPSFINERLGSDLSAADIKRLLENVEFVVELQGESLQVTPPFWRMDIELDEDIVEEVGRLYGFDRLPVSLPKRSASAAPYNKALQMKQRVRHALRATGANEVLTYSFVHGDLITKAGQDTKEAYHLRNALSPDLQYYRLTLTPSLLAAIHPNIKAGYEEFALFELNRTHVRMHGMNDENVPAELDMIALVYAANDKTARRKDGAAFYQARVLLDELGRRLGIRFRYEALETEPPYQVCKPFDWRRSALVHDAVSGEFIGQIGEYTAAARANLKLPAYAAGFEIGLEGLLAAARPVTYRPHGRFPGTSQDVTFEVDSEHSFATVETGLDDALRTAADEHGYVISHHPTDIFAKEGTGRVRYTFSVDVSHPDKTLRTEEVNGLLERAATSLLERFGATRI